MMAKHSLSARSAKGKRRTIAPRKAPSRYAGRSVAIIISGPGTGETGGAERFYSGLQQAFRDIGCLVEVIPTDASEPDVETIINNYETAAALDLSKFDFVVSTKVPSYAAQHPRHVAYIVHTVRVFDDMFDERFAPASITDFTNRARVHNADLAALRGAKALFAIGHEVADRLHRWRGLSATVIHPPMAIAGFRSQPAEDFFFIPGRLHPWKRLDLLVAAIKSSQLPMVLKIAGTGEQDEELRNLISTDSRIQLIGRIDDATLIDHYSRCIAVPFPTKREDYGYVTLEAFASGKPVVTFEDSGEPSRIVEDGKTGLVVQPTVDAMREALEALWNDREAAKRMGQAAEAAVSGMDWRDVAMRLADAAFAADTEPATDPIPVTVVDMQPIDPPVGGGRLRLLGLYHDLGHAIDCTYVGSYDWPGESFRDHRLTPTLREIDVPLSDKHHALASEYMHQAGGLNVIDLMFSHQASASPKYLQEVIKQVRAARVVIFSHPWVYPLVAGYIRQNQTVIYDAQNVESHLRAQLINQNEPMQFAALRNVISDELALCRRADWILACSHEDLIRFHTLFGVSPSRMRVVPNGVMAFQVDAVSVKQKRAAKAALNLPQHAFTGIFIGSPYGPNVDAAHYIANELAPTIQDVLFVVAGGVGEALSTWASNLLITGQISEQEKALWMAASDFAINPMMSGSGTNIKMFDFMAAGLPIVTTDIGARGIDSTANRFMLRAPPDVGAMAAAIQSLQNRTDREELGYAARQFVEEGFAWERISNQLGAFAAKRHRLSGQPRPRFSVVVPSYERHDRLEELMQALHEQVERDFEVIVVDQSASPWVPAPGGYGVPLNYYHSPVKGAVRARNTGAMMAESDIIAFIDDDCIPRPDWLLNARHWFEDSEVAGIEGLIRSDHLDDPEWRPVTNMGFEGIGFMTANLMVRSAAFQYLGGFDLQFDKPHFREDTDFGWRLQSLGKVPFAHDVEVFHPAQPRSLARESLVERTAFFKNDAKLFIKNPEKYKELFFRECQFLHNEGFIPALMEGFKEIGYERNLLPGWILDKLENC